jgi:hypothetical protein
VLSTNVLLTITADSIIQLKSCISACRSLALSVYILVETVTTSITLGNYTAIINECSRLLLTDECGSLDGGLDPWLDGLWPKIMEKYPLPPGMEIIPADVQYPFICEIYRVL